ncbi:Uncharacterised protein [Mycobacteroides abscessus subsp. abscessus]|nr:Uncharacterised protein [Mycobacteroides abscessus subsp. abscessus]SHU90021.1 Uncharacterised protein [Mycobacteroides abscessus subsp. abscessus]SHW76348.1 Uncharacterised protein [Mycobacteroides abscessus subsp. abscessus]SHX61738.1 Uncharacterised protein [Mycobacteroides abscessus subsp. abscessus]SHX72483.1 Uncharacterised protein [Mycobacteroides abscessus subsp. abscessus]
MNADTLCTAVSKKVVYGDAHPFFGLHRKTARVSTDHDTL